MGDKKQFCLKCGMDTTNFLPRFSRFKRTLPSIMEPLVEKGFFPNSYCKLEDVLKGFRATKKFNRMSWNEFESLINAVQVTTGDYKLFNPIGAVTGRRFTVINQKVLFIKFGEEASNEH